MTTVPPTLAPSSTLEPGSAAPVALPASYAQELMWLVDRAAPGSSAYNVPRTRRLVGALDVDALGRAFTTIVERHEILRTTYAADGDRILQVIHPPRPLSMDVLDLRAMPHDVRAEAVAAEVAARARRPFDLTSDMLLRVALIRVADAEYVLHIDTHHIACDGWSRDILFRELRELYREYSGGTPANLPTLAIQYGDFAVWMREQLEGARLEELLGFWRHHLDGADLVLQLPTDRPRAAVPSSTSLTERLVLPPALAASVKALGEQHGASLYMTLLAAIASVLHRYSGQEDVLIGSPIAGRALAETQDLIGYFANTIVQRASFAGDPSFAQLLDRIRESALGAYEHQDMPFEKLVLEMQSAQQLSVSPLFQVVFTMLGGSDAEEPELGDVAVLPFGGSDGVTKFDLTFFMAERPDGLLLMLRGRADLFSAAKLARMLRHVRMLLEGAVESPSSRVSALPLLGRDELTQLAALEVGPADAPHADTVLAMFDAQVTANPMRSAVTDGVRGLSYAELDQRANGVARRLVELGVQPGDRVGIGMERSVDAIVALLAVMKAGAAYVPLPPGTPAARLERQVEDCGARLALTRSTDSIDLPRAITRLDIDDIAAVSEALNVAVPASSLAYVLYTSGSTGVPKGVGITHANLAHYTHAITPVLCAVGGAPALAGWQCGVVSSLGADLGHTALFPALTSGGTVHVLSRAVATEPAAFAAYVGAHALDLLKITPSHLRALTGERRGAALAAVLPRRVLVTGGEALDVALARRVLDAGTCALLNHYGPTETTVGATTFRVTAQSLAAAQAAGAQTVPIGTPLAGGVAAVCDAAGARMPLGVPGELWLAGPGVAGAGYVGDAARTAERFQSLKPAARGEPSWAVAYRTGDRARWLVLESSSPSATDAAPTAVLEFLGRTDQQVKVRGYRLELGDVESVLLQHLHVRECIVVAQGATENGAAVDAPDDVRLVAYVVLAPGANTTSAKELEAWAASQLPDYGVPSVVVLDALPLTANGKIDRRALPDPVASSAPAVAEPRTATEVAIASIWAEVLKRDAVGVDDDFVALGGHSLLAIRVLGKLSRQFGIRLPLRTLFDAPTVAQLAELVDLELRVAALEAMSDDEAAALLASRESDPS